MRKLFAALAVAVLASCGPFHYVGADAFTYEDCTWEYPCYYASDLVFVWGWGYFPNERYVYYYSHPMYRPRLARTYFLPRGRPIRHDGSHDRRSGHEGQKHEGQKRHK